MTSSRSVRFLLALLAVFSLVAAACGGDDDDASDGADDTGTTTTTATPDDATPEPTAEPPAGFEGDLTGTFTITAGTCDATGVSGSWFRMVQPQGSLLDGPFIENFDSACDDSTYSLLTPGTDGGLTTGAHQPAPDPAFDERGNGLAAAIVAPVTFFGVDFAVGTDPTLDPVTLTATDGSLTGSTGAFTAYYGGMAFNQGAPAATPSDSGITTDPSGTIDPETGEFVLEWTSGIEGGAFGGFTGVWHLEGVFTPAG
ncbi:MAG: hypothetical protein RIE08_12355 [Acidimicrobiales bacterium]